MGLARSLPKKISVVFRKNLSGKGMFGLAQFLKILFY